MPECVGRVDAFAGRRDDDAKLDLMMNLAAAEGNLVAGNTEFNLLVKLTLRVWSYFSAWWQSLKIEAKIFFFRSIRTRPSHILRP